MTRWRQLLKRWEFLGAQDIGTDPYLDRLRLLVTPFCSVYLHHIHKDDGNRALHDHPWWFASLVLTGSYVELVADDKLHDDTDRWHLRTHKRFSLHRFPVRSAHTIVMVNRPLWTLVFCGPPVNPRWGFYPDGKYLFWEDYEERETVVSGWPSWKQDGVLK